MFCVFIAAEGFTLPGRFIVKEITLMFENGEYNHFLLEPPSDYFPTREEITTIKYTTNNIHGINYTDGTISYEKLTEILCKLHNCKVFCYGENTRSMLQSYIPFTPVVNIQQIGYKIPSSLPPGLCGRNHLGRNCSFAKAIAVKNFFMSN